MSGCSQSSNVLLKPSATYKPTVKISPTATPPVELSSHDPIDVISQQNLDQLEEIAVWGQGKVFNVALSPDDETVAVYTATGIYLYDSKSLNRKGFIKVNDNFSSSVGFPIAYSPDGEILAYASTGRVVNLLDATTTIINNVIYSPIPEYQITNIEFNRDSEWIVITSKGPSAGCDGQGANYAIYDLDGVLHFDKYWCASYSDSYYRFTPDNKVYFFYTSVMTPFHPLELWVVDLSLGNISEFSRFDWDYENNYSEPAFHPYLEDAFYDISPDGKTKASLSYEYGEQITNLLTQIQDK